MENINNNKRQAAIPTIIAAAMTAGIIIGLSIAKFSTPADHVQRTTNKYGQILNLIDRDYVDSVNVQNLAETSINAMLKNLDPHTRYIPKRDKELAESSLEHNFEGVGIEFNIVNDTLFVQQVIEDGPASKAGIHSGDKIIKVNGDNIAYKGLETRDVFNLLRGPKGSKVNVSVKRAGHDDLLTFEIIRDKIPSYAIDAIFMVDKQTGYVKISRFASKTHEEFLKAIASLKENGMDRLIIDLRNNGGGYLHESNKILDEMLEEGKLMVYTKGKNPKHSETFKASATHKLKNISLIVFINENSASASEIVAGGLQDNDRALIVGRRSFGKGLVQRPVELIDDSEIRLTISRYYTPSGRSIQKPYDDLEFYTSDYQRRLESGELFVADSIKFADSLMYKTANGRTVYGGGGITPDIFIAKDTSEYSHLLGKLYSSNAIREFSIRYCQQHTTMLQNMSFEDFKENFTVDKGMMYELIKLAKSSKVVVKKDDLKRSTEMIKNNIKALIARNMWGKNEFHRIMLERDEYMKQSKNYLPRIHDILRGAL